MTNPQDQTGHHVQELPVETPLGVPQEAGVVGRLVERLGFLFAAGIVIAALMLLMEVFLRYVLNRPTIWAHEASTFLCALAFLFGGLYCASRDSHIRVVLLYDLMPAPARRWLDVFISTASMVASGFFAWAAWLMVAKSVWAPSGEIRLERSGSAWNPAIPAWTKIFLFVVMIVMTVQFALFAWNQLRRSGSHRTGDKS
ncbi:MULTISPECIES: TRAP transporter small permease subunit [Cereibacter]|uniref:TRAP transporter small permease subunit n=1 Tax=Cereibacter TaxID=1653176 RepID=UPI000C6D1539|nr:MULTISPECIES: TRAP transporter small permease [Cereibacter]MEA5162723.1 TRAP transporter small permease [Cereibacter johrii]RAZ87109.1 TRAP transporter small permease [Cereibacter johrii]RDS96710.1 TRAP transporter small permease [Cereibacter sphaeroides f. sp. denitrificans]RIA00576.1 TRAP transporter small permease [Cereibacter sphaeroides]